MNIKPHEIWVGGMLNTFKWLKFPKKKKKSIHFRNIYVHKWYLLLTNEPKNTAFLTIPRYFSIKPTCNQEESTTVSMSSHWRPSTTAGMLIPSAKDKRRWFVFRKRKRFLIPALLEECGGGCAEYNTHPKSCYWRTVCQPALLAWGPRQGQEGFQSTTSSLPPGLWAILWPSQLPVSAGLHSTLPLSQDSAPWAQTQHLPGSKCHATE